MRAQIAIVMAVVAMLGAVAAFRTAFAEQETSRLERTLNQGQMLELANRQGYLDKASLNARMSDQLLLKSVKSVVGKDILAKADVSEQPGACAAFPESRNVTRVRLLINGHTLMARSWVQADGSGRVGIVVRRAGVEDPANRHATETEDCGMLVSFATVY